MDRNVTIASVVALIAVVVLFLWGWRKAVPATPDAGPATAVAAPPPFVDPNAGVIAQAAPTPGPTPDATYWVTDDARLATRSLDDLLAYNKEDDRPSVGYPNGTTRNEHNLTPKQSLMLMDGLIIDVPDASPVDILAWGSDDLAQVRVREGKKAGSVGWINKHLLRYNHNGTYDAAFPVDVR